MSEKEPLGFVADARKSDIRQTANSFDEPQANRFLTSWENYFPSTAHPGQLPPDGEWRVWLVMGGRGFGKTRAGAEWVRGIAEQDPDARIALIGGSLNEVRSVMVEGESGIVACCPASSKPIFEPSLSRLRWPNGAQAYLYSAAEPEKLRGPQHSHAWCDEIAKWPTSHDRATKTWDNMLLGLRLGKDQRIVATTTPRNVPLLERVLKHEATKVTGGSTAANSANLPDTFLNAMEIEFGGTQLARQELQGELLTEREGALWSRNLLEQCREHTSESDQRRIVVAVDPPTSPRGDACGIIVAGLGSDGLGRVLADCSIEKASPEKWARAVSNAAVNWGADRIVAEANQGGAMVESVLRAANHTLPVKLVHASRAKVARAEPVAALYEAGRVRHAGMFSQLEDQLCGMMIGGEYAGPGRSPDRADALVWALTELLLKVAPAPRVIKV